MGNASYANLSVNANLTDQLRSRNRLFMDSNWLHAQQLLTAFGFPVSKLSCIIYVKIMNILSYNIKVMVKVKSPIVNKLSHSSVTDASSAHLRFQGPEPAVCCKRFSYRWDHTVLPATRYRRTHFWLTYGRRARPPHITSVTFPALKPVPICTACWTKAHVCEQLAQFCVPAQSQTCNLRVTSLA